MRLFVGIGMPERVKEVLGGIQHSEAGIRWTPPTRFHLTLRFIGEVEQEVQDLLISLFSGIEVHTFDISIKGIGYFPRRRYPKIVWAGVEDNAPLLNLQSQIESMCRAAGLKAENHPYVPHITIGKVQGSSKKETLAYINQYKKLRINQILVREFVLFESRLTADGAIHAPVCSFPLVTD